MGNENEKFGRFEETEEGKKTSEGSLFCIIQSPAFIGIRFNPTKHVAFVIHNRTDEKFIFTELTPSIVPSLKKLELDARRMFKIVVRHITVETLKRDFLDKIQKGKQINTDKYVTIENVRSFVVDKFFKGDCVSKGNEETGYEIFPKKTAPNSSYSLIGTNCQAYCKGLMNYFCGEDKVFQYEVGRGIVVVAGIAGLTIGGLASTLNILKGEAQKKKKKKKLEEKEEEGGED